MVSKGYEKQIVNECGFGKILHFCSMDAPRIALVEFGGSHDECLLTQVLALKQVNASLLLVCDEAIKNRNPEIVAMVDEVYLVKTTGKAIGDLKTMKLLVNFLQNRGIQKVVFNTAQGGHVRNLALLMPKHITCYGIIHTIKKFNESFTQKIIHKAIKHYLVLSDDLLPRVKQQKNLVIQSFYPVDFPETTIVSTKTEGEIWVTIPGGVETRRKDLSSCADLIEQSPKNVRFIFLGKTDETRPDAAEFLAELKERNLLDRISIYTDFVPHDTFFGTLNQSDFLLPLIHPQTPSSNEYIKNQISGSFTLSFGLKIPLLIHEAYATEGDLQKAAFFYREFNFGEQLELAIKNREAKKLEIEGVEKWKSSYQQEHFLKFIGLAKIN